MGLSLGSLQILASLNLSTEQMAGVVQVLTVELAPLEEEEARLAEQRDKARLRKVKSRQCHADKGVTDAGQVSDQGVTASRVDNLPSLSLPVEKFRKEERPPINPPSEPFDDFWPVYPKRAGDRDRKAAHKAFNAALKRADAQTIIAGAARYAAHCDETGKTGTEFVRQARTWLNANGWEETYEISRSTTNGIHNSWSQASAVLAEQDRREGIRREGSEDDFYTIPEPQGRA